MKQRRKHSKIDKLPIPLKDAVEQMMQSPDFTYSMIRAYIISNGYEISESSVQRHAASLNANLQSVRMVSENFRALGEEMARYPQLDTTEGIIRLLSHQILEAIQKTPEERWADIEPDKLIAQASSLIRAASYKANIDIKNKDVLDAGYEQVKTLAFEAFAKERPDLYKEFTAVLAKKVERV